MQTIEEIPFYNGKNADQVIERLSMQWPLLVETIDGLPEKYLTARKVGKVPVDSSDVDPTDREGDINWSATDFFILVDNSGTLEWRTASLTSF